MQLHVVINIIVYYKANSIFVTTITHAGLRAHRLPAGMVGGDGGVAG